MTMRGKQISARTIEIQQENWGYNLPWPRRDFRLRTSDFGLQAFDFGIVILSTRCVRYTPTLMDGSKYTFLGIISIVISRFWPSRLRTSDFGPWSSDF